MFWFTASAGLCGSGSVVPLAVAALAWPLTGNWTRILAQEAGGPAIITPALPQGQNAKGDDLSRLAKGLGPPGPEAGRFP